MSTLTVKELAAPTGYDLKIASGETLDLKSQGTVTMPAGSVLQVVQSSYDTSVSTTSDSSYTDTGLAATITPSATSSKILVRINQSGCHVSSSGTDIDLILLRGSTEIAQMAGLFMEGLTTGNLIISNEWLDSPSTTSATTYKTQFRIGDDAGTVKVQNGSYGTSVITLMEVAG